MDPADYQEGKGRIVITWTVGPQSDPADVDTYYWGVTCEPQFADAVVTAMLAAVARTY